MSRTKHDKFEMDGITIYTSWQVPNLERARRIDAKSAPAYGRRWDDKPNGRQETDINRGRRWTDR